MWRGASRYSIQKRLSIEGEGVTEGRWDWKDEQGQRQMRI